jgi:hypothetical protein
MDGVKKMRGDKMKNILLLLAVAVLSGCATYQDGAKNITIMNLYDMDRILSDQTELINRKSADHRRVTKNIFLAAEVSQKQSDECNNVNRRNALNCLDDLKAINRAAAEVELLAAKHFKDFGNKDVAKDIYRKIIVKYTGGAYKSHVKQAEFGLEDLR